MKIEKAAAIYCTGMTTRLHQLTTAMAEGNEALVIFGTTVGLLDYRDERPLECTNIFSFNKLNKVEHQYIVGGKVIYSGVVVVVFAGSDLHVRGDYVLGWKPLGKEMTVTKTVEGIADSTDLASALSRISFLIEDVTAGDVAKTANISFAISDMTGSGSNYTKTFTSAANDIKPDHQYRVTETATTIEGYQLVRTSYVVNSGTSTPRRISPSRI